MKKIKNNYIKRLVFILGDEGSYTLDAKEEKKVLDSLAIKLLKNPWIEEIKAEPKKQEIKEKQKKENNKRSIYKNN